MAQRKNGQIVAPQKLFGFRIEDSWQRSLDPCTIGNTYKNCPEGLWCTLSGESESFKDLGKLSIGFYHMTDGCQDTYSYLSTLLQLL